MSLDLLLQYGVVGFAVAGSAFYVFQRQWPGALRRLRGGLAIVLLREPRSAWRQRLGRWIAPQPRTDATACGGCAGGCSVRPPRRH